jgi:hypothetical protein
MSSRERMGRLCFASSSYMRFKPRSLHCDRVDGNESILNEQDITYHLIESNVVCQGNRVSRVYMHELIGDGHAACFRNVVSVTVKTRDTSKHNSTKWYLILPETKLPHPILGKGHTPVYESPICCFNTIYYLWSNEKPCSATVLEGSRQT